MIYILKKTIIKNRINNIFLGFSILFFTVLFFYPTSSLADNLWYYNLSNITFENEPPAGSLNSSGSEFTTQSSCNDDRAYRLSLLLSPGETLTPAEEASSKCTQGEISNQGGVSNIEIGYELLSGLPGLDAVDQNTTYAQYFNTLFKILIGLTTLAAVVMVVRGGIMYMTTDAFTDKKEGIGVIKNALWGLLLAIFAWIILNTINPNILNLNFLTETAEITISGDFFIPEAGLGYTTNSRFYLAPGNTSNGVDEFVAWAQMSGAVTTRMVVTSSTQAQITATNQGGETKSIIVPIGIGKNGFSEPGQARVNDGKTPKGSYVTGGQRFSIAQDRTSPIMTTGNQENPPVNVGASFISINAYDENGNYRGIGIHGFESGNTGKTNGCISMRNIDLESLAPLMNGISVIIQ